MVPPAEGDALLRYGWIVEERGPLLAYYRVGEEALQLMDSDSVRALVEKFRAEASPMVLAGDFQAFGAELSNMLGLDPEASMRSFSREETISLLGELQVLLG